MPYTFGGATGDDITHTGVQDIFHTDAVGLLTCWVRPTTLTATRCIWSYGTVYRLAIDTTTTSVRLTLDGTTDGTFTAPMGLAVDTWTFIAVAYCMDGGPTGVTVRMWSATETTGPVERTVTAAAGTGAFVNSGTALTIGNAGAAGTLAFQGDIGGLVVFIDNSSANPNVLCSLVATSGAISQAKADELLHAFVAPLWRGDVWQFCGMGRMKARRVTPNGFGLMSSLDTNDARIFRVEAPQNLGTVNGATVSARRTPRGFDNQNNSTHIRGGRRGYLIRS